MQGAGSGQFHGRRLRHRRALAHADRGRRHPRHARRAARAAAGCAADRSASRSWRSRRPIRAVAAANSSPGRSASRWPVALCGRAVPGIVPPRRRARLPVILRVRQPHLLDLPPMSSDPIVILAARRTPVGAFQGVLRGRHRAAARRGGHQGRRRRLRARRGRHRRGDHGLRAVGRARPGAGPPGRTRRRPAAARPRHHGEQDVRLGDEAVMLGSRPDSRRLRPA